jgi:hypothetical protein
MVFSNIGLQLGTSFWSIPSQRLSATKRGLILSIVPLKYTPQNNDRATLYFSIFSISRVRLGQIPFISDRGHIHAYILEKISSARATVDFKNEKNLIKIKIEPTKKQNKDRATWENTFFVLISSIPFPNSCSRSFFRLNPIDLAKRIYQIQIWDLK